MNINPTCVTVVNCGLWKIAVCSNSATLQGYNTDIATIWQHFIKIAYCRPIMICSNFAMLLRYKADIWQYLLNMLECIESNQTNRKQMIENISFQFSATKWNHKENLHYNKSNP
jgi:hypothetical protein